MRRKFDEQLELLHTKLIEMGALCEDGIFASLQALSEDHEAVAQTAAIEERIDHAEREIETLCMKLLLHQQPVARDLRTVSSALKMISDMERIGDQASDIAEITAHMPMELLKDASLLQEMARAAAQMVTDSVESFVREDVELARRVQRDDDKVDELFARIRTRLVDRLREHPERGEDWLDLLMIAKYLERIGDHAVNVAEWVEYAITGVHAKE